MDRKKRELHQILAPILKQWRADSVEKKKRLHEMLVNKDVSHVPDRFTEDELIRRKWMEAAGLDMLEDYE